MAAADEHSQAGPLRRGRCSDGAVFQSIRLNFERIRNVPGTRPLEVVDSIRGLNDLLEAYAQAVTEYERSVFRMWTVLGLSPLAEMSQKENQKQP